MTEEPFTEKTLKIDIFIARRLDIISPEKCLSVSLKFDTGPQLHYGKDFPTSTLKPLVSFCILCIYTAIQQQSGESDSCIDLKPPNSIRLQTESLFKSMHSKWLNKLFGRAPEKTYLIRNGSIKARTFCVTLANFIKVEIRTLESKSMVKCELYTLNRILYDLQFIHKIQYNHPEIRILKSSGTIISNTSGGCFCYGDEFLVEAPYETLDKSCLFWAEDDEQTGISVYGLHPHLDIDIYYKEEKATIRDQRIIKTHRGNIVWIPEEPRLRIDKKEGYCSIILIEVKDTNNFDPGPLLSAIEKTGPIRRTEFMNNLPKTTYFDTHQIASLSGRELNLSGPSESALWEYSLAKCLSRWAKKIYLYHFAIRPLP